jgi:ABC-type uncharacterized transport system substrate-binding protein
MTPSAKGRSDGSGQIDLSKIGGWRKIAAADPAHWGGGTMILRAALAATVALYILAASLVGESQQPAMPVIGYLSQRSSTDSASIVAAFRQGLKEEGYVEGQNVAIEFRYAEGQIDRVPALASDLVRRKVSVFVATGGTGSVVKAKPIVPRTIPIVFAMGGDPVKLGVVASLARPGDNITGVSFCTAPDFVDTELRVSAR